jgi:uncharacterized protein (TIGR03437 family)
VTSKSWKNITFATFIYGLSALGFAQNFDTTGTSTVKGAYFVRQVLTANLDQSTSAIGQAVSLTGIMTFDGAGKYAFAGQKTDSTAGGTPSSYSVNGTYAVSGSGLVQITNPIDTTDTIFGGVGAIGPAAIVGSSTEGLNDDVFIAIPAGSAATNSSIQGSYNAGFIDFLQANASQVRDGYFTLTSNGSGSFGTVTVNGAMANQSSTATNQSLAGVTYSITSANGSGTLTFPTSSSPLTTLVSGPKTLYSSADGNILIGGNPGGYDLIVAIKAASGSISNATFQGTYFTAALENDASDLANGNNFIDSFYGSVLGLGEGDGILHSRLVLFDSSAYDYTAYQPESFSASVHNDGFYQDLLGANGQSVLQVGTGTFYSLIVGLQAKTTPASGVFIDPLKVWNAASYAPITNSVAPGEFVSIFGSGLASGVFTPSSLPLPNNLGGVQVTVNGRLAPLSYVGPNQINFLMPYATSEAFATFQVTNNNVKSNLVTLYTNLTAPGVFTGTPSGIGVSAVLHANFTPVTQNSPALSGETVLLYLTGLGSVTPTVNDGAAASGTTLSNVDESIGIDLFDSSGNDLNANIPFAGLAPGFAGLYQINFTIPAGLAAGEVSVDVGTQDAYTTESFTYIGSGASANAKSSVRRPKSVHKSAPRSRTANKRQAKIEVQ